MFETLGVEVFGISTDSVSDQARFVKQQKLNFRLLSDPDGSAAGKYGVLKGTYAGRVTFVLDEKGVVRHVEEKVNVRTHGEDLITVIEELLD